MPWGEGQDVPILFPPQGDWATLTASLDKLLRFTTKEDAKGGQQVRVACGHTTANVGASALIQRVNTYAGRIKPGEVPTVARLPGDQVAPGGSLGEEMFIFWQDEDEDAEFSMCAPECFEKGFHSSSCQA